MPATWGVLASQSVLLRGWGLESNFVWPGYIAFIIWFIFFLILAVKGIKRVE